MKPDLDQLPAIPRDESGPTFREPWQAQAFAMAVSLREKGVFTWGEWATTLGAQIAHARDHGDPDQGETYYHHWLAALEHIVAEKGLTDPTALSRYRHAWSHAAARVPHGQPIELLPSDF